MKKLTLVIAGLLAACGTDSHYQQAIEVPTDLVRADGRVELRAMEYNYEKITVRSSTHIEGNGQTTIEIVLDHPSFGAVANSGVMKESNQRKDTHIKIVAHAQGTIALNQSVTPDAYLISTTDGMKNSVPAADFVATLTKRSWGLYLDIEQLAVAKEPRDYDPEKKYKDWNQTVHTGVSIRIPKNGASIVKPDGEITYRTRAVEAASLTKPTLFVTPPTPTSDYVTVEFQLKSKQITRFASQKPLDKGPFTPELIIRAQKQGDLVEGDTLDASLYIINSQGKESWWECSSYEGMVEYRNGRLIYEIDKLNIDTFWNSGLRKLKYDAGLFFYGLKFVATYPSAEMHKEPEVRKEPAPPFVEPSPDIELNVPPAVETEPIPAEVSCSTSSSSPGLIGWSFLLAIAFMRFRSRLR